MVAGEDVGAGAQQLGVELDEAANEVRSDDPRVVSTPASKVAVCVVPTNEELAIAQHTVAVID